MPKDDKKDNKYYCKQCGREIPKYKHELCEKHYNQWIQYGFCLDDNPRCEEDPNEVIVGNTYSSIVLYDSFQEEIDRVIIDTEDVDKIKNHIWTKKQSCIINERKELLQNVIMGNIGEKVEIINGDILDNRKENLKVIRKKEKKNKNPYMISKKNKNKIIVEFIGESHNGVVGSSILISYPTKEGKYEKILIELGMIQKNGALKDEYFANKEVMDRICGCGEIKACFVSHPHL